MGRRTEAGDAKQRTVAGRLAIAVTIAVGIAALVAACAALRWEPLGPRRIEAVVGAEPVGSEECLACHEDVQGHTKIASYHAGCETCHGDGSLHADSEEPADIRYPGNGDCLTCHATGYDTHLAWGSGAHSRAGLLCSDCHNPHAITKRHLRSPPEQLAKAAFPEIDDASGLCVQCHRDVGTEVTYPSHHPVPEGAMSCLSCHDPHEDLVAMPGETNRLCARCHQDYVGPWIFEHPPVVNGCVTCHNPHGAVAQNLLEPMEPALCMSCHPLNDTWHHEATGTGILDSTVITEDYPSRPSERVIRQEAKLFLDRCSDCHNAIHGSMTDEHLRH